jgi:hypothetical protein
MKEVEVKGKFAEWLDIEEGAKMPRNKIFEKMYKILKEKDMVYQDDKRIFHVDKETAKIFGVSKKGMKVKDISNKDVFSILNMQKKIKYALENSC